MKLRYLDDGRRRQLDVDVLIVLRHDGGDQLTGARAIEEHFLLRQQVATCHTTRRRLNTLLHISAITLRVSRISIILSNVRAALTDT